jgi:spermidine synthase
LVYQITWLRMLRHVFGASTMANAAVLAIFMGGLGAGGLLLGKRADKHPNPLALYARLELGVAAAAALSPFLIWLVRQLYLGLGGQEALGTVGGTALRLVLSALVLGVPTFLMGGTLPAAVKAAERAHDLGRRSLGLIYAMNTLGAVTGTMWATFAALELLGTRASLWSATAANALIALIALYIAHRVEKLGPEAEQDSQEAAPAAAEASLLAPQRLVWVAAGVVGFVFLLMELCWYRILAPILGGSSYTFGLILAVALLGIGIGGLLYAFGGARRRPTLMTFALTCLLEAFFLGLPLWLGDDIAVWAMALRPLGFSGFWTLVAVWGVVAMVVIFPAALLAGYQFPVLIALLGTGEEDVGQHIGVAYAWNTGGAILGSLAGGFGLMPILGAVGVWRLGVATLVILGLVCVGAVARRGRPAGPRALAVGALALLSVLFMTAQGPTAFWRHSPIGIGHLKPKLSSPNDLQNLLRERRRPIIWETDGVESSVALNAANGLSFIVHGKPDGNAIGDAPTQVMSGMIPAALHPRPESALVIGLGTGSTAGWLAAIPSVKRVDAVEFEEAILHVAAACRHVNQDALNNPQLHVILGDGREVLLASDRKYDVIHSEPSNPYRAGIASLFTLEFYRAVFERLEDDGIFGQWIQGYDVAPQTIRTIIATLRAVFPSVEIWETLSGTDLLLVARKTPHQPDLVELRQRLDTWPYRSALQEVWRVDGVEGLYAGFVAGDGVSAAILKAEGTRLNTDDRVRIEWEFARTVGRRNLFELNDLRSFATERGFDQPPVSDGINWSLVEENRGTRRVGEGRRPSRPNNPKSARDFRALSRFHYAQAQFEAAYNAWKQQDGGAASPMDLTMLSELALEAGAAAAPKFFGAIRPSESKALEGRWHLRNGRQAEAGPALLAAMELWRDDPWAYRPLMGRTLTVIDDLAQADPAFGKLAFASLSQPFAAHSMDSRRQQVRARIGIDVAFDDLCLAALEPIEPNPYWSHWFLEARARCYGKNGHPLAADAAADLESYTSASAKRFTDGL